MGKTSCPLPPITIRLRCTVRDTPIPFAMTLQGHLLLELGSPGEAFRSPSSPEEDPLKMNSVEKGCDPYYNL